MTEVSEHLQGNRMKKKKKRITSARAGSPDPPRDSVYFTLGNMRGARSLALSPRNFLSVAFLNCEVALYAQARRRAVVSLLRMHSGPLARCTITSYECPRPLISAFSSESRG